MELKILAKKQELRKWQEIIKQISSQPILGHQPAKQIINNYQDVKSMQPM